MKIIVLFLVVAIPTLSGKKTEVSPLIQNKEVAKRNTKSMPSMELVSMAQPKAMPSAASGMQNSRKSMEGERENNQPSTPQMNFMWQQMGQSRNSQHKSMRPNDKLHKSHHEHDQDFISFMKASDEHNQRFHTMNQNIHQESPVGSHGMMPQKRYAEMANAKWDIQNRWHKLRSSGGRYGPSLGYGMTPPYWDSASSGSATTSGDSGSGAVAVFPNAKAGNCGIPLLLSCSPSVVSGTLSKASSYSAPAYRN